MGPEGALPAALALAPSWTRLSTSLKRAVRAVAAPDRPGIQPHAVRLGGAGRPLPASLHAAVLHCAGEARVGRGVGGAGLPAVLGLTAVAVGMGVLEPFGRFRRNFGEI